MNAIFIVSVHLQCALLVAGARLRRRPRPGQSGQASAEYALVVLGAAAVALLVHGWATRTDQVGRLLDGVMERVLNRAP